MGEHFLISRTDAIGDVVLSLHLAKALKEKFPNCKITWFGKTYTQPIIEACKWVDAFLNFDEWSKQSITDQIENLKSLKFTTVIHVFPRKEIAIAAKKAAIPLRIGTSHRVFHWTTCNKLLNIGRKNSELHEAQLNFELLAPLGMITPDLTILMNEPPLLKSKIQLSNEHTLILNSSKKNILLHPKSQGSAREWGIHNFKALMNYLPADEYHFFITGTNEEALAIKPFLEQLPSNATNLTGKFSLGELIAFIAKCDGLIAASTGPLHIAAATGIYAIGIFPPMRPIHPGRWAPIGQKASYLCAPKTCNSCKKVPLNCTCMGLVTPEMVGEQILSWK